jgi:HAD superfamily hydrolase (TIGR01490 family)
MQKPKSVMKRIAFFDFDGTITTKDSFIEIIRYVYGDFRFIRSFTMLIPLVVGLKIGFINRQKAKERLLKYFFGGMSEVEFQIKCNEFCEEVLPNILNEDAINKIIWHKENQDEIIVVSASPEHWLKPWCNAAGIKCISTRLEIIDGKITGSIEGQNCYGAEKVKRIKEYFNLSEYEEIYSYGDSKGDVDMLRLASFPFYKKF